MKLSEKQEKQAVSTIVDCYNYSKSQYEEYYELCDVLQKLYSVEIPEHIENKLPDDHPGLVPPDIFTLVNELVSGIDEIVFSASPFFKLGPASKRTSARNVRYATSYLDWASVKSELEVEFVKTILSAAKFAAGVGYVELDQFEEYTIDSNMPIRRPEKSETGRIITGPGFRKQGQILYPRYRHLPLRNFFPDPSLARPNWAIYRSTANFVDILMDMEQGDYDRVTAKEVEDLKGSFPGDDETDYKSQFSSTVMQNNFPIELLHFRGWLPLLDEGTQAEKKVKFVDVLATVGNRNLLMQFDLNEWHYPAVDSFIITYLLLTDQEVLYPVGKTEASMDTFLHQFYLRNQRLMNVDRLLNPQWWTDSQELPDYMPAESGRIHKLSEGVKTFEQIQMDDVTNKAYVEVDIEKDEIRHIYGTNEYSAGRDPRRKETAYGISTLVAATDKQRKFENKIVVLTGLKKVLRRYLELGQEHHETVQLKMYDSDEILDVGRTDLFGEFSIKIDINTPFAKPVQRQEILQAVKLYQNDTDVDPIELKREHFRIMEFQDVEKLVPDPKEKILHIEKENMWMVKTGQIYPVLPQEPHELHYKVHEAYREHPVIAAHQQMHLAFMQQETGGKGVRIPLAENEPDLLKRVSQSLNPKNLVTNRS